jgi:putative ATPase
MTPLAEELRPQSLDDFIGQQHLVGKNKPLWLIIENGNIPSMIFWGPSGVGKTTLARIIAKQTQANFIELSAVVVATKEIREIITSAQNILNTQPTIVFLDEIHHFNKSQQDLLLPHIENGTIILIGATTENPAFALNNALLSRCNLYIFKTLTADDLQVILQKNLTVDEISQKNIINYASGDARRLINIIENIKQNNPHNISEFLAENITNFDNGGDEYYNLLSALHKSVRGSHPDAALYYFTRLINNGVDAKIIARRALAIASEDIGLADPRALTISLNAWDVYHRVGESEGLRAIAEALVYLALAPKSNALYTAFNTALAKTKNDNSKVPQHLCNAPTQLAKDQGFGKNYQYAHDFENGIEFKQKFFPNELGELEFYQPTNRGLEIKLKEKLTKIRELRKNND